MKTASGGHHIAGLRPAKKGSPAEVPNFLTRLHELYERDVPDTYDSRCRTPAPRVTVHFDNFDAGLIVKLYVREQTSPRAVELFHASDVPPLCYWQRFEA